MHTVRLGTRGSRLALLQADLVAAELKKIMPDVQVHCKVIKTLGDKILETAPFKIEDKGIFTAEIEKNLLDENIDIAVHSLKDLPSHLPERLCLGAVLKRENPCDALLSQKGYPFADLPYGSTLGTSSLRRTAQIKSKRPDICIHPIRGNVETRIKKMQQYSLDGIILAYAGVKRLGLDHMITELISPDIIMPAVGQGTIAVEIKDSNTDIRKLLKKINNRSTLLESIAERSFLQELEGGCQTPVACMATLYNDYLELHGMVASIDGTNVLKSSLTGNSDDASALGKKLARKLLVCGADKILKNI